MPITGIGKAKQANEPMAHGIGHFIKKFRPGVNKLALKNWTKDM